MATQIRIGHKKFFMFFLLSLLFAQTEILSGPDGEERNNTALMEIAANVVKTVLAQRKIFKIQWGFCSNYQNLSRYQSGGVSSFSISKDDGKELLPSYLSKSTFTDVVKKCRVYFGLKPLLYSDGELVKSSTIDAPDLCESLENGSREKCALLFATKKFWNGHNLEEKIGGINLIEMMEKISNTSEEITNNTSSLPNNLTLKGNNSFFKNFSGHLVNDVCSRGSEGNIACMLIMLEKIKFHQMTKEEMGAFVLSSIGSGVTP